MLYHVAAGENQLARYAERIDAGNARECDAGALRGGTSARFAIVGKVVILLSGMITT
jgi:hypothetical protein